MAGRVNPRQPLMLAGFVALALLAQGEAAPAAWPVGVAIDVRAATLQVTVDGAEHALTAKTNSWRGLRFEQPGPVQREYQVDGSDTTATNDRDRPAIENLWQTPFYRLLAWLRDEASYSRWEDIRVVDAQTGLPQPVQVRETQGPNGTHTELSFQDGPQSAFRVEAALRRPEAAAYLWLLSTTPDQQEGLELDRDRRNARWLIRRGTTTEPLPRWFFPEQPLPFAAALLNLLGRSTAAGYALVLAACGLGRLLGRVDLNPRAGRRGEVFLAVWLLGAALVSVRLYHQLPHILDAVSYSFQAGVLRSGRWWLEAPPLAAAFKGPFEVVANGHWFSQYPPGAPAAYALGGLVGLDWLVGALACVALIGATSWTAGVLFGSATGLVVLGLGVLSPFVLFQSGSFLSHPIAGGLLAASLAVFVQGERTGRVRWYACCGALLGVSFVTREAASVLFALPFAVRLLAARRGQALGWVIAAGLPFVVLYVLYNSALTGNPFVLPRSLFDPSDRFGFGDGIGFHRRHTLGAGLANTDELLTLLQFDLFGWPPLVALGLLVVPFLLGRAKSWDVLAALGGLAFVVAYTAYFYHGIALGPRYYFEALPWLLLLAGRGAQHIAQVARSRAAVALVLGVLSLYTLVFYLPAEIARRTDYSALPGTRKITLAFVRAGLVGPRLDGVPVPALILTDDWWIFNTALAPLNCPAVPDCPALFALATNPDDVARLRAAYPGRVALFAVDHNGRIDLEPG